MASITTDKNMSIHLGGGHSGTGSKSDGDKVASVPCRDCKGLGRVPDGKGGTKICQTCGGTGRVVEE